MAFPSVSREDFEAATVLAQQARARPPVEREDHALFDRLEHVLSTSGSSPQTAKPRAPLPRAPTGSASRKRKSESSLEDDIAAYKQSLDDIIVEDMPMDLSCDQVRTRINKVLDSNIMNKGEFCKAIGCGNAPVNNFLKKHGRMEGANSGVYTNAWEWFKQREVAGLKLPDVKKRQKTEAAAAAAESSSNITPGLAAKKLSATPDISNIHLKCEETDSVPVFDTCDEIRRKINAHLKTPGLTQAQFCRDLFSQLNTPKVKSIQSSTLTSFRGKKGPKAGCTSTVFYAAYVYFEKLRIAQGKPKNKHREDMERIWACQGGFDLENDGRESYIVMSGERPCMNQYGQVGPF
ncbi:uncharacterized protein BCR38DRAFT_349871 [Pseudomassariella vexata]|uniref:DUF7726 domain-containing protein n=1 Tax=Pseudomassariella vexata TaxID=1141098 RepID=A0A1Y2DN86_9PEZI|nr:uncharacterized protein BCR38DRAFT_349871 [Pseudomassariella vexata]ORY60742.1 hypothetical protein BCR38DRAFT_349871 [Pseudomassariella vexata]